MAARKGIWAIAIIAALTVGIGVGTRLGRDGEDAAEGNDSTDVTEAKRDGGRPVAAFSERPRLGVDEPEATVAEKRPPRAELPVDRPLQQPPPPPPPHVMKAIAAAAQTAPVPEPAAASHPEPPTRGSDTNDERYWRERANFNRERLVATYESCLAHARTPYKYVVGDSRSRQIIDASAFAEAQAAFLAAQASYRFLQDEARRAGVPPGWVRLDWNSYPRTPSPEDGTCERTLPEEISPR